MVADASVRNGGGKNVGLRLQVLRHESAIRCADATDFFRVYKGVFLAETLGSLDDIVGYRVAEGVHVAGGKFLPETGCAARLNHINDVAQRGVGVVRIAALEITACRTATAIVVHDHRIFLRRVEVRRQVEAAVNRITS